MLLEKRKRAVDKEYREKMDRVELKLDMEIMLGSINTFTKAKQRWKKNWISKSYTLKFPFI